MASSSSSSSSHHPNGDDILSLVHRPRIPEGKRSYRGDAFVEEHQEEILEEVEHAEIDRRNRRWHRQEDLLRAAEYRDRHAGGGNRYYEEARERIREYEERESEPFFNQPLAERVRLRSMQQDAARREQEEKEAWRRSRRNRPFVNDWTKPCVQGIQPSVILDIINRCDHQLEACREEIAQ